MNSARVMVISGVSRGLGRGLAEQAIARGYFVIGCSRTKPSFSDARFRHVFCDVTNENSVVELFRGVRREYGAVHALINNAGVIKTAFALLSSPGDFEECYRVNVEGAFLMSREAAKSMRRNGGRIVNVTSAGVKHIIAGASAYIASKCAIEGLTRVMAEELRDIGITVNAIGPGLLDTGMMDISESPLEKRLAAMEQQHLFSAGDVWAAMEVFLKPEGSSLTGQVIYMET